MKHFKPAWKVREEVVVRISLKNVLTPASREAIKAHATGYHHKHMLLKRADEETAHDPDYKYEFGSSGNDYWVSMIPRHAGAIESRPITTTVTVDDRGLKKINKAFDTGKQAKVSAKFKVEGPPSWMTPPSEESGILQITPVVPDLTVHLGIRCSDKNGHVMLESNFVEMKVVEPYGRKVRRLKGVSANQPIGYVFHSDLAKKTMNFSVSYTSSKNPLDVAWYLDTLLALQTVSVVEITDLHTGQKYIQPAPNGFALPEIDDMTYRLVKALRVIAHELNLLIQLPDRYSLNEVRTAEIVAEVLTTGKTKSLRRIPLEPNADVESIVLGGYVEPEIVKEIERDFAKDGYAYLPIAGGWNANIFGSKISLGESVYNVYATKLLEASETQEFIQHVKAELIEGRIPFAATVDVKQSYMKFLDWSEEEDPESVD